MKRVRMHLLFPSTYDRADVLMSAGCSTFVSAALLLVMPRIGILMLEALLGLFLIGCAVVARTRLRRKAPAEQPVPGSGKPDRRWFDRYDAVMIGAVILVQSFLGRGLRHLGWSEGSRGIFPLVLLGVAILLKPRLLVWFERRKRNKQDLRALSADSAADEPWWKSHVTVGIADQQKEEKGND